MLWVAGNLTLTEALIELERQEGKVGGKLEKEKNSEDHRTWAIPVCRWHDKSITQYKQEEWSPLATDSVRCFDEYLICLCMLTAHSYNLSCLESRFVSWPLATALLTRQWWMATLAYMLRFLLLLLVLCRCLRCSNHGRSSRRKESILRANILWCVCLCPLRTMPTHLSSMASIISSSSAHAPLTASSCIHGWLRRSTFAS